MTYLRRASLLAFAAFPLLAAPAAALDVQIVPGTGQLILASPDATTEQSRVTLSATASEFTVTESGAAGGVLNSPDASCTVVGLVATCTRPGGTDAHVFATLGGEDDHIVVEGSIAGELEGDDGNDQLTGGQLADTRIEGGAGADTLNGGAGDDSSVIGGAGADVISGGEGADFLQGDDGDDVLNGNDGSDTLEGGAGADDLNDSGSSGTDTATYGLKAAGVTVTLNGLADDGNTSDDNGARRDNVSAGIESVNAGPHADTLVGSSGTDRLFGGAGDDDITGGAGADTLVGNDGNDTLRARDGVADERIDCDAESGPAPGTADAAFIDGAGLDPAPTRCEAVDAGTEVTPPSEEDPPPMASGAPTNTFPPSIRGRLTAGERLVCDPGTWSAGSAFSYSWTRVAAGGARTAVSNEISVDTALADAGSEFECAVTASLDGEATTLVTPLSRLAAPVIAPTFKKVTLKIPQFVSPTKACFQPGRKNYCEAEDVRKYLIKKKLNLRWKGVEAEGLRAVPAALRKSILPGEVFATRPKAGTKVVTSDSKSVAFKVSYYVPNADRDCPVEENVNVRGGKDYTLADLVVGLSLRDALRTVKEHGCKAGDYDIDYRYAASAVDARVSAARKVDQGGRDQLRMTVQHSAPDLQLGFQPVAPGGDRLPMRLGDNAGQNEIQFVSSKKQNTDFAVSVATRVSVGFKRVRVELRNPSGDLVDSASTNADGLAVFKNSKIAKDGTYELWASVTDGEGDALVGWKSVRAVTVNAAFAGFTGRSYAYTKKTKLYSLLATAASRARAASAESDMRAAAERVCNEMEGVAALLFSAEMKKLLANQEPGALDLAEASALVNASTIVCAFAVGGTLAQTVGFGVVPTVATLGGTQTLGIDVPRITTQKVLTFRGNTLLEQTASGIQVGRGALGFVHAESGITLYAGGLFEIKSSGGTAIGAQGPVGRISLDALAPRTSIETFGQFTIAGLVSGGAGNIISGGAGNIISGGGGNLISGGGGNIVSGGGGNLISNKGGTIISGGAGNIVSGGGGNIVSGGGGN